jgi:hypothetical protein
VNTILLHYTAKSDVIGRFEYAIITYLVCADDWVN